ncbi:MAG: DUF58 domain-containing protein [Verrucomicrobiales bacterium]
MVPGNLLLWLTALIVVPAATVMGTASAGSFMAAAAVAVLVIAALVDAALSHDKLGRIAAVYPPVVHGTKGRAVDLECKFMGFAGPMRVGLQLPDSLHCQDPVLKVGPPGTAAKWSLLPLKRGRHVFTAFHVETRSQFGFFLVRRSVPAQIELRIYPNLHRERRGLAAVFLNRGGPGIHARAQVGKGREFDHLRDYVSGDDYGDIHWKTTARRGLPVMKTFQVERTREVYAIIDHSRLSARSLKMPVGGALSEHATGGEYQVTTQIERSIESALVLALAAERQHDRFGMVTFAEHVTGCVRSSSGHAHYVTCRNALFTLEPHLVSPSFDELFIFLRRTLTRRSLLVILTDLSDPLQAESFAAGVRLISRHHLVLVSMIRPESAHPLFARVDVTSVDDVYRDLAGHFLWHDLQEVGSVLAQQAVHFTLPDCADLTVDVVSQYMNIRRRQLL